MERRLQVVLKVAERCNLACGYCYYFEGQDQSFRTRPALLEQSTVNVLADFLRQGASDLNLSVVQVIYHGGEPLLLPRHRFSDMCTSLEAIRTPQTNVQFACQTNGVLITPAWAELFKKFDVNVGISIDGKREQHDARRPDKKGRGTYDRVVNGVKVLRDGASDESWGGSSIISVLDGDAQYAISIPEMQEAFGVRHMSFLLPDVNPGADLNADELEKLSSSLESIVDLWVAKHDFTVRQIEDALEVFRRAAREQPPLEMQNDVIVVQSDGEITLDDSLIPIQQFRSDFPRYSVHEHLLRDVLDHSMLRILAEARRDLPLGCSNCAWRELCRGGDLENRYRGGSFDNPSIYCAALKRFYARLVRALYVDGLDPCLIEKALFNPGRNQDVYDDSPRPVRQ